MMSAVQTKMLQESDPRIMIPGISTENFRHASVDAAFLKDRPLQEKTENLQKIQRLLKI
jgi:hypothetical protein